MFQRVLIALCLLSFPNHLYAQATLLWELQEDFHGGGDIARAITLSGRTAVVVGDGFAPLEGESESVIQALGRATGVVQWSDRIAGTISGSIFIASRQQRAFTASATPGSVGGVTRIGAYDVFSGTLLWEDVWPQGSEPTGTLPTGILATQTQVIAIGY